nr:LPXTG cell wall anchor domain-containing protein [Fundicoccus ignavus]
MVVKAKATIATIEAKEVVAKSLFDGWIRSVSAQTLTFDKAQVALITQVQALTAYLTLIEQGGYISASSIDQILVTTQAAIDDLVAAGQEKEDSSPEESTQTVTKGKTKDGQLPNTGETNLVWLSTLGLVVLSLGVALVGTYFKRNKQ